MVERRHVLLGWGSRGDVEPLVALALGLQEARREVVVVCGPDYGGWVRSLGLAAMPFSIDMQRAMRSPQGRSWLGGADSSRAELATMREVFAAFAPVLVMDLRRIVRPGDLVVSGAITFNPALTLQEQLGVRHVAAVLTPGIPTRSGPASLSPVVAHQDSLLNRASGTAALLALWQVMKRPADLLRSSYGLPHDSVISYSRKAFRTPVLVGASRHLLPPPTDWPPVVHPTGAWFLPDAVLPALEPRVEQFVATGPAPVYVGLGSMTNPDPVATMRLLLDAVAAAGVRAVVHRGTDLAGADLAALVSPEQQDTVLFVDAVAHARLFPRMAAVVHHGGAGTTHAATRSGVPQVVVPHIGDQPYWGRRVHDLGLGPAPIRRPDLTVANLAAAIRAATHHPAVRHRAALLGRQVRSERGVDTAVRLLERLAREQPMS